MLSVNARWDWFSRCSRSNAADATHSDPWKTSARFSQNCTALRGSKPAWASNLGRKSVIYRQCRFGTDRMLFIVVFSEGEGKGRASYLAETTSASISCFVLVQYSPSFVSSPDPALPKSANASLTKGPSSIVTGNTSARIKSERSESTPGTKIVIEDSVSRWCDSTRCDSSCARSIARSVVCSDVGWGCAGAGGAVGKRRPKSLDQSGVPAGGEAPPLPLPLPPSPLRPGSVGAAFFERMSSRKPE